MNKIAFEELYMQQLPGLFRLAQSILRQPADAEDAVQQAVLQAWRQLETIQPGKEKAYLARIVINECHNIQRQRQRTEEWKNAEMKRFHGLAQAKGWGFRSMAFQAKFTAIAVNLKRIANLMREKEKEKTENMALIPLLFSDFVQLRNLKLAS